jgi:hypothetical protein
LTIREEQKALRVKNKGNCIKTYLPIYKMDRMLVIAKNREKVNGFDTKTPGDVPGVLCVTP